MVVGFNRKLILQTVQAIKRGTPYKEILNDPMKILSGKTEKIIINKRGQGIQLFKNIVEEMIKRNDKWMKKNKSRLIWYSHILPNCKYTIMNDRKNETLISMIENKEINNCGLRIVDVPVEDWSYTIESSNQGERVCMLI